MAIFRCQCKNLTVSSTITAADGKKKEVGIAFNNGVFKTNDELLIEELRKLAKNRLLRISEDEQQPEAKEESKAEEAKAEEAKAEEAKEESKAEEALKKPAVAKKPKASAKK